METADILLALCMFLGAALYTSVGHAGASAYLALMALFATPVAVMRPTALALNIAVASFTSFRYLRAGLFRWRTVWPFMIGSVPLAFIGGAIQIPGVYYRPIVAVVLFAGAARLLWPKELGVDRPLRDPPVWLGALCGAGIGLLSGLTGTGGGIFLSPLVLFAGWSATRPSLGVASVFILANSIAGLLGNVAAVSALPDELPLFAAAVLAGAAVGTTVGIRLPARLLLKALGLVLIVAGLKLLGAY